MIGLPSRAHLRGIVLCSFAVFSAPLSGCSALRESAQAPAIIRDSPSVGSVAERPFDLRTDCMPGDLDVNNACSTPSLRLFQGDRPFTPEEQALRRNRLQDYLIWRSEKECMLHKTGIVSTQATTNFALNTITTGVTTVAAIVAAPATNILAAIGAISNGTRSHFNEDMYQQYIGPAIVRKIDEIRKTKLTEILGKRGISPTERPSVDVEVTSTIVPAEGSPKRLDVRIASTPLIGTRKLVLLQDYTIEEAIGDVERFHQLCSIPAALGTLLDKQVKFSDTAKGIQQRIDLLRAQIKTNTEQIAALKNSNIDSKTNETMTRLGSINDDIARQIMVLQQQMLTAPFSTD